MPRKTQKRQKAGADTESEVKPESIESEVKPESEDKPESDTPEPESEDMGSSEQAIEDAKHITEEEATEWAKELVVEIEDALARLKGKLGESKMGGKSNKNKKNKNKRNKTRKQRR